MESVELYLDAIPRHARDDLARTLAASIEAYFKQPGAEEKFQAWLMEYEKRKAPVLEKTE